LLLDKNGGCRGTRLVAKLNLSGAMLVGARSKSRLTLYVPGPGFSYNTVIVHSIIIIPPGTLHKHVC